MSIRSHLPLLLLLASLAPAGAQTSTHPITVPKVFTGTYGTTTNAYPFARTYGYFQIWYRGDSLKAPKPVLNLGWRAAPGITVQAQQLKLQIVLSSSTQGFSNLSKTFAANHGKDRAVFFKLKTLNLPAQSSPANPDVPAIWIKGDAPFLFKGPNLVVDVDIQQTTTATSTQYRSDAYTGGNILRSAEKSCGQSSLAGSYSGTKLTYTLSGAPPKVPLLFLLSTRNQTIGGMIPLPLDLSPLGMKGCVLGVDPILALAGTTDSAGSALFSGNLDPAGDTAMLFAQAVHASPANPAGLATTNVVNALLGTAGLSTYLYCWTTVGPTATSGPYTTNRSPVLMVMP